VVRLYAGALIPGFMLAGLYIVYVIIRSLLNPKLAPKPPKEQTDIPNIELFKMLVTSVFPISILILAVLGSIIFGLATPLKRQRSAPSAVSAWPPVTSNLPGKDSAILFT
jgi:TRAP-type mannitol/chloroaromatic compound transport system permease large subunit